MTTDTLPVERIPADLFETPEGWELSLALPGVAESDLEVDVEDGVLRVRATRAAADAGEARVLRSGPADAAARLERDFVLPEGLDADAISAELEHGLLRVHLRRPEPERRTIAVRSRD